MGSLDDFDKEVKTIVSKGKLSPSLVTTIVDLAMGNISSDAHLVSTLVRGHKKASPSAKLSSLYLVDAIAREARTRLKKQLKETPAAADSQSPVEGVVVVGTYATFLAKMEGVLTKMVVDCWENGPKEHRDKVRKVLDIWLKAGTFGSTTLVKISNKLLASTSAPVHPPTSTTINTPGPSGIRAKYAESDPIPPVPSPPPELVTGTTDDAGGIPASVRALLAASQSQVTASGSKSTPQLTNAADVQRAIDEARAGSSANKYRSSAASTSALPALDPAQLSILQALASASPTPPRSPPGPSYDRDPRRGPVTAFDNRSPPSQPNPSYSSYQQSGPPSQPPSSSGFTKPLPAHFRSDVTPSPSTQRFDTPPSSYGAPSTIQGARIDGPPGRGPASAGGFDDPQRSNAFGNGGSASSYPDGGPNWGRQEQGFGRDGSGSAPRQDFRGPHQGFNNSRGGFAAGASGVKRRWDGAHDRNPPPPPLANRGSPPRPTGGRAPPAPGLDEFGRAIRPESEERDASPPPFQRRKSSSPPPSPPQKVMSFLRPGSGVVPPLPPPPPSSIPPPQIQQQQPAVSSFPPPSATAFSHAVVPNSYQQAPPPAPVQPLPSSSTPAGGFSMASFNPADPSSWQMMGQYYQAATGMAPTNEGMMQWMMQMQQMQQMAMAGGGGGAQGGAGVMNGAGVGTGGAIMGGQAQGGAYQ